MKKTMLEIHLIVSSEKAITKNGGGGGGDKTVELGIIEQG